MSSVDKIKNFLIARKQAYCQIFKSDSVHAQAVMEDLAKFCRAHETTFHTDARAHAVLEGRREVWLRIQSHLNLNSIDLWKLYGRGNPNAE